MSELHARAGEDRSPDPRDPKPESVRVLHAAKGESAVPRAWSADVVVFDHEPADDELVALLGEGGHMGVVVHETPWSLRIRPWRFPMKWVVAWMLIVAAGATGMNSWMEASFTTTNNLFFLAIVWLLALPMMLLLFWSINRSLDSKPDVARLDLECKVLEIPKSALRVRFSDIEEVVELWRWVRDGGDLERHRQLGILLQKKRQAGLAWEYHTLGWDKEWGSGRRVRRMNRIVAELGRPVRKIRLSIGESRALGDAPDGDS